MPSDENKITDEVVVEVNGEVPSVPTIPDRPGDSAAKAKWVEYGVALGLHPDTAESMTRAELAEWSDGGS